MRIEHSLTSPRGPGAQAQPVRDEQPVPDRPLRPGPFGPTDIRRALRVGWGVFLALPGPSLALGAVFALIAVALLLALIWLGVTPLWLVLTGGFLLIGPPLLAGFFALARRHEAGLEAGLRDALSGYGKAGAGFWALSALCAFLLLIWITDAGILYAFLVGSGPLTEPSATGGWMGLTEGVRRFAFWSGVLGAIFASGLYVISAFAAPLLFEDRVGVLAAIQASARAILGNPGPALVWALVIAVGTLAGILLPVLLPITLPVLAYGSFSLYRTLFPPESP